MNNKIQITSGKYNADTGLYERNPYAAPPPEVDAFTPGYEASEPTVDPSVFQEVAPPSLENAGGDGGGATEPTNVKTPVDLKYVQDKARRLVTIEDRLEELKVEEAQLKEEQRQIRIFQLPEAMFELEIKPAIIGVGNRVVEVEALVTASLPSTENPEARQRAIDYVVDLKLGGNIKYALEVDLPKGDAIMQHRVLDAIRAVNKDLNPRINASIHHKTYTSMISKLIASGKVIDKDLLGVWVGNIARVRKEKDANELDSIRSANRSGFFTGVHKRR
jgi:hypothetical protein